MQTEIGKQIAESLRKQGMTQKALAERLSISEGVLSRYISGDREPKPDMVANIATALNTTSDYLLGIEADDFDFRKTKRLLARNSGKLTDEEKKTLINALFGEG